MKKHIVFILTSAFLFSTIFYACTQEGLNPQNKQEIELDNFEADLHAVFGTVSKNLSQNQPLKKQKLTALFLRASLEVYPGTETEESFKSNYLSNSGSSQQKSNTQSQLEALIHSSYDANHAIQKLSSYLTEETYSLQEKQEILVLKESIAFLALHKELFSSYYDPATKRNTLAKSGCSWWEGWGSCTSGIIAGAISGAAAGCEVGETIGNSAGQQGTSTGCVVGGAIGAVAGGIIGAVGNCGSCEN